MRILHLSSERTWRGGEQQIAYLMQELKEKNIEVFAASRRGSEFSQRMISRGFNVIEFPFSSEIDFVTAIKIKNFVKKNNIDIVHMHTGHGHTLGVLSHFLGHEAKLVLSKRTDYPVKDNFFSKWKFNYKGINKILCVSGKIKEVISKDINDKEKLEVVYSGVDIEKFPKTLTREIKKEFNLPKDSKVVINTSALAEHKDFPTFIKTAKVLTQKHDDLYFVIYGDGPLKEEVKNLIEVEKLEKKVILAGFQKNLETVIGSADLFLITSKDEGLGTSILDAFSAKLPVVATRAGGIPEIVIHEKTGLTSNIGDFENLALQVEELLYLNQPKKEKLILGAQELVAKFSYKETANKTLSIYKKVWRT